jgi:hypothetical protein
MHFGGELFAGFTISGKIKLQEDMWVILLPGLLVLSQSLWK